jgi:hypothetical protein
MSPAPRNLVSALDRFIPDDSPLGRAGDAQMLLRVTGGNIREAAFLAALARKESEFGRTSGRFVNNPYGWGVHLGRDVNTAPSIEAMSQRVLRGLRGSLYRGAGLDSAGEIINRYAPPSENNTALYQDQVSEWMRGLGIDPRASIFEGGPTAPPGPAPANQAGAPSGGGAPAPSPGGPADRFQLLSAVRRLHQEGGDRLGALAELAGLMRQGGGGAAPGAPAADDGHGHGQPAPGESAFGGALYEGPLPQIPAQDIPFGADPQGDYDWAEQLAKRFGLTLTSGYRNPQQQIATGSRAGLRSRHLVRGGAADISGSADAMRRLAEWAIRSGRFAEVFYDPLGYYWDNGRLNRGGIGGHSDHVHLSYGRALR